MDIHDIHNISTTCTRTEFVGTAVLDTIGLVISGVDDSLLQQMNVGTKYHCLGLFSSRTGAAGQITAIDDAVKATNTEVLSIELPRDTKGWGGHGTYSLRRHEGKRDQEPYTEAGSKTRGQQRVTPSSLSPSGVRRRKKQER